MKCDTCKHQDIEYPCCVMGHWRGLGGPVQLDTDPWLSCEDYKVIEQSSARDCFLAVATP